MLTDIMISEMLVCFGRSGGGYVSQSAGYILFFISGKHLHAYLYLLVHTCQAHIILSKLLLLNKTFKIFLSIII